MSADGIQWLSLVVHWFHVIIAVMWIGASFYLISWENKFNRETGLGDGIEGNFWTIQGGDFYYVEKLKNAPRQLPEKLHWFKYEAYLTWLSGFILLCIVLYADARAMMVDRAVADISPAASVGIGVGTLLVSWLVYRAYSATPLARKFRLTAVIGLICLAGLAYFLTGVLSQRAAFIHVGAVMGTLMAGNVFFVIIPWHKRLIRAIEDGRPLDALYAARPGYLSRHNHYMTLPVFFIMLGGHFPIAFAQPHGWATVTAITLAAGLIKHYHNQVQKNEPSLRYLAAGAGVFAAMVFAAAWPTAPRTACHGPVTFAQAAAVIETRCVSCHSAAPRDEDWTAPPSGVVFDTAEQIVVRKDRILQRAVITHSMPAGNKTGMTPEERRLLGCWIEDGIESG